jgi:hypothetical protein
MMKTKTTGLPTRFARPTRFQVRPRVLTRAEREVRLGELKNRLLRLHLAEADTSELVPVVRRAAEDAASLAWATPYPLLLLPELVEEKVAMARIQAARQAQIRRQTAGFLAEAA